MALADLIPLATPSDTDGLRAARVLETAGDGDLILDTGIAARRAAGCLVAPAAGDRVLVWSAGERESWAIAVLERDNSEAAELSVAGARGVALRADDIDMLARRRLSLSSLADLELNSVTGALALRARHLFTSVQRSMVETAGERVSRLGQWLVDARSHLRLHARDSSITADEDIRVDAERINMG